MNELEQELLLSLGELARHTGIEAERVLAMIDEGILEPQQGAGGRWRFTADSLQRVTLVLRLQRDLDVNLAGAALALDLLEELAQLRRRVHILEDLLFEDAGGQP